MAQRPGTCNRPPRSGGGRPLGSLPASVARERRAASPKCWQRSPSRGRRLPAEEGCNRPIPATQRCFQAWIGDAIATEADNPGRLVAIDGKTCRGSHDGVHGLHIVSAWASEEGSAPGQVATDTKSDEIMAIPQLLEQIDLGGTLVTIDAMGCQKEIVRTIVAGGGDCVIAVKDNQPKLMTSIRAFFHDHLERDLEDLRYRYHETREGGHGRIFERSY